MTGLGALVERHQEDGLICARCARRARFLVARHDTSGRTTSCAGHLEATMASLSGPSPLRVGARARMVPWSRLGTILACTTLRDPDGRAVLMAWMHWEDGEDTAAPLSRLVPVLEEQ